MKARRDCRKIPTREILAFYSAENLRRVTPFFTGFKVCALVRHHQRYAYKRNYLLYFKDNNNIVFTV